MKKIKRLLIVLILSILIIPKGVFATGFTLDENMSIDMDDSTWYVFTRNNIENNEELTSLGITYEYMNDIFIKNSAYLDAMLVYQDTGEVIEMMVRRTKSNGAINSANYSDAEYLSSIKEDLAGKTVSGLKTYSVNGYKYAYAEYSDSGYNIAAYFVIINGYNYTINIQKNGAIDNDNRARLKAVIDSAQFTINKNLKEPSIISDNTTYKPASTGSSGEGFFDSIVGKALIGALIGGAIGGLSALVLTFAKGNKNKKTNNNNMMNNGYNQNNYPNGYYNPNQYNNMNNNYNNQNNGYNNGNYYNGNNNNYNYGNNGYNNNMNYNNNNMNYNNNNGNNNNNNNNYYNNNNNGHY